MHAYVRVLSSLTEPSGDSPPGEQLQVEGSSQKCSGTTDWLTSEQRLYHFNLLWTSFHYFPSINSSMVPSPPLVHSWVLGGNSLGRDTQTFSSLYSGALRSKSSRERTSLQRVRGLPLGLLVPGSTSPGRRPGSIPNRTPGHLCWLLPTWRTRGSTLSSSWATKVHILSPRMTELLTPFRGVT